MTNFKKTQKLYHYTSLTALAGILKSRVLKFGALSRMNDITEAVKETYNQDHDEDTDWDIIRQVEEELNHIGLISLTQDGIRAGYAINSMWGHYADKGEGCCIIFDKNVIIEECKKHALKFGRVIYKGATPHIIAGKRAKGKGYLESNFNARFLRKSSDWKSEQEFRIVSFNKPDGFSGLPIMNAIMAVVFHTNCKCSIFDCPMKQGSIRALGDIPALEYHYSNMWGNESEHAQLKDINGNDWVIDDLSNYTIDI